MVIQRIQSLYLFAATLLIGIYAFLPSFKIDAPNVIFTMSAFQLEALGDAASNPAPTTLWATIATAAAAALLTLVTIFKYKTLKLQIKLTSMCALLTLALIITMGTTAYFTAQSFGNAPLSVLTPNCMPVCAFVLILMARAAMKRDKKTLESYDRIR